ncbi:MAG: hypothetical protein KDJ75_06520 [Alphaproteobacteria bacterium]|nr:hypothetical protein [Alphaproteobacteria bacterium]
MADVEGLPEETRRLQESFASIGIPVEGDPAGIAGAHMQAAIITFLNQLSQVFVEKQTPSTLENYDSAKVAIIQEAVNDRKILRSGENYTRHQKLGALINRDYKTLGIDSAINPIHIRLRSKIDDFYNSYSPEQAAAKSLEFLSGYDRDVKDTYERLKNHAPQMLSTLPTGFQLLENADRVFADIAALADAGLFDEALAPEVLAQADPVVQLQRRVETFRETLGLPPGNAWEEREQNGLIRFLQGLQGQTHYAEGWDGPEDGLYTEEYATHLAARVEALPESTEEEREEKTRMQRVVSGLEEMRANPAIELLPKPPMSEEEAIMIVKGALEQFGPILNEQLAAKKAELEGEEGLVANFKRMLAPKILDIQIPEVTPGDKFRMQDQSALQAVLTVLSHARVLDIPGGEPWVYTPETGTHLLAKAPAYLRELAKDESLPAETRQELEELTKDNTAIEKLVEALDTLYANDRISYLKLFRDKPADLAVWHKKVLLDTVEGLKAENPAFLPLMDAMARGYSGFGLHDFLTEGDAPDFDPEVKDRRDQQEEHLASLYKDARAGWNGSQEDFDAAMTRAAYAASVLPFGSRDRHSAYQERMRRIIKEAGEKGDDYAAQHFALEMMLLHDSINADFGLVRFNDDYRSRSVTVDPAIIGRTFVSKGGGTDYTFDNDDVAKAYNRMQYGFTLELHSSPLVFTANDGTLYVAAIDKQSKVFTIQEFPADEIEAAIAAHKEAGTNDKDTVADLQARFPGFALVVPHAANQSTRHSLVKCWYEAPEELRNAGKLLHERVEKIEADYQRKRGIEEAQEAERIAEEEGDRILPVGPAPYKDGGLRGAFNPQSKAPTPQELKDMHSEAHAIQMLARRLQTGALLISPCTEEMALLERFAGRELRIGEDLYLNNVTKLKSVTLEGEGQEPVLAVYDSEARAIRAVKIPDELLSMSKDELIAALDKPLGMSEEDYRASLTLSAEFKILVDMAENTPDPQRPDVTYVNERTGRIEEGLELRVKNAAERLFKLQDRFSAAACGEEAIDGVHATSLPQKPLIQRLFGI